jgi:Protein of unknown function (DUF3800)
MHIFIDESGTFVGKPDAPSISVAGALVIPSERIDKVFAKYGRLRKSLPLRNGEVKGSSLNESHVAAVVEILRKNEALLELVVVNSESAATANIAAHKSARIKEMMTARDGEEPAHATKVMAQALLDASDQLYVQGGAMLNLVWATMENSIKYLSQRRPKELASFSWVIDSKDPAGATNWERSWSELVVPYMCAKSIMTPFSFFAFGDYRHFGRFFDLGQFDKDGNAKDPLREPHPADVEKILKESFRHSSKSEPGLELADIVINASRRAIVGNLGRRGWEGIPRLMIHRKPFYFEIMNFDHKGLSAGIESETLLGFQNGGRMMAAPRFAHLQQ